MLYIRKTPNPTSSRTRINLKAKKSLIEKTRPHTQPTSRGRMIRRKGIATFVVRLIVGLLDSLIVLINVGTMIRPQML
jgi:hypothetical protein